MAYTRIHAVRTTVGKAAAYICDANKTDEKLLVTSYDCSPETVDYDFKFALSQTSKKDSVLAYHVIQSFAPGEVTPDQAHALGNELAARLLNNEYSYIVSTHTNTDMQLILSYL